MSKQIMQLPREEYDRRNLATLGQIACAQLRRLPPTYDRQKIRLAHALLIGKATLHGQPERALRDAGLGGAGFWIIGQVSDQNSFVHGLHLPSGLFGFGLRRFVVG